MKNFVVLMALFSLLHLSTKTMDNNFSFELFPLNTHRAKIEIKDILNNEKENNRHERKNSVLFASFQKISNEIALIPDMSSKKQKNIINVEEENNNDLAQLSCCGCFLCEYTPNPSASKSYQRMYLRKHVIEAYKHKQNLEIYLSNKISFNKTIEDLKNQGFFPCPTCCSYYDNENTLKKHQQRTH